MLVPARPAWIACIALLLLLPSAAASLPVSGDVRVDAPMGLDGTLRASTSQGVLDLAADVAGGKLPLITWTRAWGHEVVTEYNKTSTPVDAGTDESTKVSDTPIAWGPGGFRPDACAERCLVLLMALPNGTLGLEGRPAAPLRLTSEDEAFAALDRTSGETTEGAFGVVVPRESLALPGATLAGAMPTASGAVQLVVSQAAGELRGPNGTERLDTIRSGEPLRPLGVGPSLGTRNHDRYVLVTLEGVRIEASPGSAARLLAPRLDLDLDGGLSVTRAHGSVSAGGSARDLRDEPLLVDGTLRLAARSLALTEPASLLAPRGIGLALSGSADTLVAGNVVVEEPRSAASLVPVAVSVALVALLLASAWRLYSRIGADDVLDNANRRALLALVRAEPGLHVTALRERLSLSEVVVRHHLKVLRTHGWVVVQKEGRARRVFAVEAREAMQVHDARKMRGSGARSLVADALCAEPRGLTQREIAARTGLAQRLVSYHLARMVGEGAVERAPGRPQRYAASAALQDATRADP